MSDNESGLDLIGVGKLAKSIPAGVWKRMAETACGTFERSIAPFTEATSGLGRLLAAKFDRLTELERINSAEAFRRAKEKIEASGKQPSVEPQAKVIIEALTGSALETDENLRELWANLIAQEFTVGGVHPAIPNILSRLTTEDAKTLASIGTNQGSRMYARLMQRTTPPSPTADYIRQMLKPKETVSQSVLEGFALIRKDELGWELTALGKAFIKTVQGAETPDETDDSKG